MGKPRVTTWSEAPELATPEPPALLSDSSNLWLAYETTSEPRGEVYAVIRFRHVIDHHLAPISDEGIGEHPYASAGLQWYAFNEVTDSVEAIRWRPLNARHWVVTFKDNTLDVIAQKAEVVVPSVYGHDAATVLLSFVSSAGSAE